MSSRLTRYFHCACLAIFALAAVTPAFAVEWPSKPVRLVVPFPPGGSSDVIGRVIASGLAERLGQNVVVDNRAGASGTIGSEAAARSAPDGYTLLLSNIGSQGIGPSIFPATGYDTMKDFTHIGMIGTFPNVVIVNPAFEAKTLQELIALARRSPGKLDFATSGNGSSNHLLGEMLKLAAGIDLVHVPYKGSGPALTDVIADHVPIMFDSLPSAAPYIKSGRVRALAVASKERVDGFSDVPTFAESGLPQFVIDNWFGISAPAGLSRDITDKVSQALKETVANPDVVKRLKDVGLDVRWMPPAEFTNFMRRDLTLWKDVVTRAKVTVQ